MRLLTALAADLDRVLGPDHPHTLATRNNLATWTGEAGDAAGAARLLTALAADLDRVLSQTTPTLWPSQQPRDWTGEAGDAAGAARLLTALAADLDRVLGPARPDTLNSRNNLATLTGEAGDAAGAARLLTALLPIWSGCSAQTTPTLWPPATTSRP